MMTRKSYRNFELESSNRLKNFHDGLEESIKQEEHLSKGNNRGSIKLGGGESPSKQSKRTSVHSSSPNRTLRNFKSMNSTVLDIVNER